MRLRLSVATLLLASGIGAPATAQHATAFDVQDGRRVYEGLCAACHGPDGNLIMGRDPARPGYVMNVPTIAPGGSGLIGTIHVTHDSIGARTCAGWVVSSRMRGSSRAMTVFNYFRVSE